MNNELNKRVILLFLVIASLYFATGCEKSNDSKSEENIKSSLQQIIVENGEIVLPLTNFESLNPVYTDNLYYFYFSKLIYEGLFDYDENLRPIPKLAESYIISDDGMSLDIKLKENVFFHDGTELTAEDVIFTLNLLKKAGAESIYDNMIKNAYGASNYGNISANSISKYSVRIYFNKPTTSYLDILTFPIIPSSSGKSAIDKDNFIPNGTGPYKFIDYVNNKEIHLKANEDYWGETPKITNITGKVFENEELILTAFEAGKVNIAKSLGYDWEKYSTNNRVSIKEFVSGDYIGIAINHDNDIFNNENGSQLKKGIMYAINRQDIIKKVNLSHATAVDTIIHPDFYLLPESAYSYGYNVEKANMALDKAGYNIINSDNIRRNQNGDALSFDLLVDGDDNTLIALADLIKSYLLDVGINVNIVSETGSKDDSISQYIYDIENGKFDLAIFKYQIGTFQRYESLLKSDLIGHDNYSRYKNPIMDNMLKNLDNSINEEDKKNSYDEFSKLFIEELPYISLMYTNDCLIVDSSIKGELNPNYYNLYNGLQNCYLALDK